MRATQEDAEGEEEDAAEGAVAADQDLSSLWYVFFQIEVALLRVISIGPYSQRR